MLLCQILCFKWIKLSWDHQMDLTIMNLRKRWGIPDMGIHVVHWEKTLLLWLGQGKIYRRLNSEQKCIILMKTSGMNWELLIRGVIIIPVVHSITHQCIYSVGYQMKLKNILILSKELLLIHCQCKNLLNRNGSQLMLLMLFYWLQDKDKECAKSIQRKSWLWVVSMVSFQMKHSSLELSRLRSGRLIMS